MIAEPEAYPSTHRKAQAIHVRRILLVLIALGLLALLVVPKLVSTGRSEASAETAAAGRAPSEPRALRVAVETVTPEPLVERLATTGTVRANEAVELVSEVAGKVEAIRFREGSRVARGELLVKIDDAELRAEQERVRLLIERAERREKRQRQLVDEGVVSTDDYELAANQLNVLRADLRLIEAQLEKTEIRAPFAGTIGLRRVSRGSYLSPQTPITTLRDVDPVKIDFTVPEKYATRLGAGGEIAFRVKGDERTFRGEIYAVEPGVDPETRSLALRARCPNPDRALRPGIFADVEIVIAEIPDALTVPAIAVVPELGGRKVFVLEDGVARERPVTTGLRTEERVQVVDGLAPGERVIVSAIQQLRPGLEVVPEGEREAAP